jgi:hypothetical protein
VLLDGQVEACFLGMCGRVRVLSCVLAWDFVFGDSKEECRHDGIGRMVMRWREDSIQTGRLECVMDKSNKTVRLRELEIFAQ